MARRKPPVFNETVIYCIPSAGFSGAVPTQRIVADMVPLCESLIQPPEG